METRPDAPPPLPLEDVARAVLELAAQREMDALLARFLELVRAWAAPSAVLAAIRDPAAESGWRLLPAVSAGSGPLGAERSLPQLVQDAPHCLERPTLVRPREEVPGVRPRDNCVVPWWHAGDSGLFVLRGVPRPSAPNLPEAVALLSSAVWPRLLGGPADRVESSVAELRRLADRLGEDANREIERLRAARMPSTERSAEAVSDRARVVELEQQLEAARLEARGAVTARDDIEERLALLERARDQANAAARMAEQSLATARRELGEARQEGQRSALELEDVRERVSALETALRNSELERDRLKEEVSRLSSPADGVAAADRGAEQRREAEARSRQAEEKQREAEARHQEAEEKRREAEKRREEAENERREVESRHRKADEQRQAADDQRRAAEEALTVARQELAEARQEVQRSTLEIGKLGDRVASLEPALRAAEEERDRARSEVERLTSRLESLRSDLASATERVETQRREVEEARAAAGAAEEGRAGARRERPAPAGEEAEAPVASGAAGKGEPSGNVAEILRGALTVLRRTPFVPPGLRVTMQEAQALITDPDERPRPWLRIVLLDRDVASLEPIAAELEAAGLDVRVANYPEELALLMKTPDARDLNAAVCDVLAFRPDQNVAGLFRSWQKDRPSLALYLSFGADNPTETERAQRVPNSLTAGRFRRPLVRDELVEMLTPLVRRAETS